jgi:hypothetical protein
MRDVKQHLSLTPAAALAPPWNQMKRTAFPDEKRLPHMKAIDEAQRQSKQQSLSDRRAIAAILFVHEAHARQIHFAGRKSTFLRRV